MKTSVLLPVIFLSSFAIAQRHSFELGLPSITATNKLTAAMFKGADAVILRKDQLYSEGSRSRVEGLKMYFTDEVTINGEFLVAKLFNNEAVEHFGSFSYEIRATANENVQDRLIVNARVVKPDSSIWVLPDSAVTTVTATTTGEGDPLTKRVLFKIPNLAPGDIVQIEYRHIVPFSLSRKMMFWYHDKYPIIESNVSVVMAKSTNVDYVSFPAERVGPPQVSETQNTWSRVWTVRGLGAIPDEVFSPPFEDVSYLTAIVNRSDEEDGDGWRPLARHYWKYHIDHGSVPKSFMRSIGLDPGLKHPAWDDVEKAYTALRKYFRLEAVNSLYPDDTQVDRLIENKEGDASDLAFLMLKILDRWGVKAFPVLIRDRRSGGFEPSVPTLSWFDRIGLQVSLDSADNIYDFDRSIPYQFELPWFLNGVSVVAVHDTGAARLSVHLVQKLRDNTSTEVHTLILRQGKRALDTVRFTLKGYIAQKLRSALYPLKGDDLEASLKAFMTGGSLKEADSVFVNDFLDEKELRIGGRGISQAPVAEMDSFLVIRPKSELLASFRKLFQRVDRYQDIVLPEQNIFSAEWVIPIPPGYALAGLPEQVNVEGVPGTATQVTYFESEGSVVAKADVMFKTDSVKAPLYHEWLAFLDNSLNAMGREITFKRSR